MEHDDPGTGWHRFRYWNGGEWTAGAETRTDSKLAVYVAAHGHLKPRRALVAHLIRKPITFHVIAWFDCNVPFAKGRLRRFITPVELRTLNEVRGL